MGLNWPHPLVHPPLPVRQCQRSEGQPRGSFGRVEGEPVFFLITSLMLFIPRQGLLGGCSTDPALLSLSQEAQQVQLLCHQPPGPRC